ELHHFLLDQAELNQFIERLPDLRNQRSTSHGNDHVIRQAPAQLLGDLEADGLRSLGVIRTQVHVYKTPVVLVRNLRAQAVDLIVAACDADYFRAEHVRTQNLGRFEIGWNED